MSCELVNRSAHRFHWGHRAPTTPNGGYWVSAAEIDAALQMREEDTFTLEGFEGFPCCNRSLKQDDQPADTYHGDRAGTEPATDQ